jgi:hypothetical protein
MPQFYQINNLSGGMNSSAEENALKFTGNGASEARDIENFVPLARGGQQKTKGFEQFQTVGSTSVMGLYRFNQANGNTKLIACCQNKLFLFTETVVVELSVTVDNESYPHFETALDRCLISDGVNTLQSYDGVNVIPITSGSPNILAGTRQTLFYQNRVWAYGNPVNPSLLYYSQPNDPTTGYSSQFVNCDNNDGQKITAITKFFIPGLLEPVILVCKEKSMGIVTGDGSSNNPYTFAKINQDFGVAHFRQVVGFSQSVVFFTPQGVYMCQSDLQNLNLHFQKLSDPIQNLLNDIPSTKVKNTLAFYDWKRDRLSFAITESDKLFNNVIYHYDTRLNAWYKERWNVSQNITATWIDTDGTWYHGDSSGKVFIHSDVDHFDGQAISAFFKTPYIDFGRPQQLKQLMEVQLMLRGNGNYSLTVGSQFDFGTRTGKSSVLTLNAGQYKWNTGTWTNNASLYQWGTNAIRLKRFYPASLFRQVQLTFMQSGINQPMDIFGLNFLVT